MCIRDRLSKVKNAGSIANSRQLKQASGDDKTDAEQVKSDIKPNSTPINNIVRNTNCPQSVSASKISDWTNRLSKKFDDEARANFLKRKIGANCININKIGVLLGYFDTQIGRYLFIRDMFSHIEDPGNMNRLYKYFSSSSYIEKLKDLQPSRN